MSPTRSAALTAFFILLIDVIVGQQTGTKKNAIFYQLFEKFAIDFMLLKYFTRIITLFVTIET